MIDAEPGSRGDDRPADPSEELEDLPSRRVIPLILAAGRGERMGFPKALLALGAMSALERVLATADRAGLGPAVVVLGFAAERVAPLLAAHAARTPAAPPPRSVINPAPERGQTSSAQVGLAAVPADALAVALWPVDHALVEVEDMTALLAEARAHPECTIVLPSHQGRAGHPALLRRRLFPAILALAPETPLRDYLKTERQRTAFVIRPSDAVLVDLDTPADLAAARRRLGEGEGAG